MLNTRIKRPPRRVGRRQSGYAAVLAMVMAGVMGLSIFGLYNSGQLTTHKQRQQNAADAVAFSMANLAARDLNLVAYTNRAMVANQVAIGQAVGLMSWANMLFTAARTLDWVGTFFAWVPGVKAITQALKEGAEVLQEAVKAFSEVVIGISDTVIGVYSDAQATLHQTMQGAMLPLYSEVIKKNDPDVKTGLLTGASEAAAYGKALADFMERNEEPSDDSNNGFGGGNQDAERELQRFDEFAAVVHRSRDPFTGHRSYDWVPQINFGFIKIGVKKYGGSEFDRSKGSGSDDDKYVWEWNAMDTVSFVIKKRTWKGWKTIETPMGWGAAHALHDSRDSDTYDYSNGTSSFWSGGDQSRWGRGAWKNQLSASFAASEFSEEKLSDIEGLRAFYDMKKDSKDLKKDGMESRGPAMLVLLEKPLSKVQTWRKVLNAAGGEAGPRTDIEEKVDEGAKMYALAKAEPYYARATDKGATHFWRSDKRREYGNLYNPYWQPRLVKESESERTAALGIAGLAGAK